MLTQPGQPADLPREEPLPLLLGGRQYDMAQIDDRRAVVDMLIVTDPEAVLDMRRDANARSGGEFVVARAMFEESVRHYAAKREAELAELEGLWELPATQEPRAV